MTTKKIESRISDYLTGETNGLAQALGDYGTTPERFSFGPPAGEIWTCERMIIHIGDGSTMRPQDYGGIDALAVGYDVSVVNGAGDVLNVLNGSKNFKTNGDLSAVCFDVVNIGIGVSGDDAMAVRWSWAKAGSSVRLIGDKGHKITIDFADDFGALTTHTFFVDGESEIP